jgi:hypothetical protein
MKRQAAGGLPFVCYVSSCKQKLNWSFIALLTTLSNIFETTSQYRER